MNRNEVNERLLNEIKGFDINIEDFAGESSLSIDFMLNSYWGCKTKEQYDKGVKSLYRFSESWSDTLEKFDIEKYCIGFSFDTSGYDYWMKNMKEMQYLHVSITLEVDTITDFQYQIIKHAIEKFIEFAINFCDNNDFDPQAQNK